MVNKSPAQQVSNQVDVQAERSRGSTDDDRRLLLLLPTASPDNNCDAPGELVSGLHDNIQQDRSREENAGRGAKKDERENLLKKEEEEDRTHSKQQINYNRNIMLAKQESMLSDNYDYKNTSGRVNSDENLSQKQAADLRQRTSNKTGNKKAKEKQQQQQQDSDSDLNNPDQSRQTGGCCCGLSMGLCCLILLPLILVCFILVVYCVPFVDIETSLPAYEQANIPFNFRDGPLQASNANAFKLSKLFEKQFNGPESLAIDSTGNMYLAVEGGFILYAHLNESAPRKRSYYDYYVRSAGAIVSNGAAYQPVRFPASSDLPHLVKIAELNGIKQLPHSANLSPDGSSRTRRQQQQQQSTSWRRECQLDEQLYGTQLYTPQPVPMGLPLSEVLEQTRQSFVSNVPVSRCSTPLGIRLSPDERYLYVIDTNTGLYRVHLRTPEKPQSTQRLVQRLIDFRANKGHQLLSVMQYNSPVDTAASATAAKQNLSASSKPPKSTQQQPSPTTSLPEYSLDPVPVARSSQVFMNISLRAIDDLVIDYGAGTSGGDHIYLSDASQHWPAHSFLFDLVETRPSGVVLRFDTGNNQLTVLDPAKLAHVRLSSIELKDKILEANGTDYIAYNAIDGNQIHAGIGAPKLNENDIFDDRPLFFVNGLELTDDKQALLIADTINRRIIKHYIRGSRAGTSDLWAWTPMLPDNIRRGYDPRHETYWVTGCGKDPDTFFDPMHALDMFPRFRKYTLKNIYLIGLMLEKLGSVVFRSNSLRDLGYNIKTGAYFNEKGCPGMITIQYNKYGDIIRSIHSSDFPNGYMYYSQVNEVIDANNEEHILYLGSPAYSYVTKLVIPSEAGLGYLP